MGEGEGEGRYDPFVELVIWFFTELNNDAYVVTGAIRTIAAAEDAGDIAEVGVGVAIAAVETQPGGATVAEAAADAAGVDPNSPNVQAGKDLGNVGITAAGAGLGAGATSAASLLKSQTATTLRSASEAYKGSTRLGHALSKHAGRNPDIWGSIVGKMDTWHGQAMRHFREIYRGPGSFQRVRTDKGLQFIEKRLPDGRGMRLNLDYTFKGFVD